MDPVPPRADTRPSSEPTRKKKRVAFFLVGCLIVAAGNWPILPLVNRIEPLIFGLPFLFIYVALFIPAVMLFLYVAYRKGI